MSKFFDETMQGLLEAVEIEENEIPKHRKKTKSSTSKSKTKSKHKREYIGCLFVKAGHPYRGSYCKFCGKIGYLHFFETERAEGESWYRTLDVDEVFEKYKDLEQKEIDDVFQKYIPI